MLPEPPLLQPRLFQTDDQEDRTMLEPNDSSDRAPPEHLRDQVDLPTEQLAAADGSPAPAGPDGRASSTPADTPSGTPDGPDSGLLGLLNHPEWVTEAVRLLFAACTAISIPLIFLAVVLFAIAALAGSPVAGWGAAAVGVLGIFAAVVRRFIKRKRGGPHT